jgi:general secretion pathway protein L
VSPLRIYAPLNETPVLPLLPRGTDRVQLVVPAAQVLITQAKLPRGALRRAGSTLAFAVEEATAAEPDANQVTWLGARDGTDLLAVVDKRGLERWREALEAAGVRAYEVRAETLLLPLLSGEWSLAWGGAEGFVRSGEFEGAATDGGDAASPPLALRMLLEEAAARGAQPAAIALYTIAPGAAPDLAAWQAVLGIPLRDAGDWDWRTAPEQAGVSLTRTRGRWRLDAAVLASLRPAAWIAGAALAIHATALVVDWAQLAAEQRALRAQMEARFRSAFPDAVSVTDPVLQMRRQLAAARHRAGLPDGGDFTPMMEKVALGVKALPAGGLRIVSYEGGRMILELGAVDEPLLRRTVAQLAQAGLNAQVSGARQITVRAL